MNKQNVRCLASFRYSSRYFVSLLIVYTIMHHQYLKHRIQALVFYIQPSTNTHTYDTLTMHVKMIGCCDQPLKDGTFVNDLIGLEEQDKNFPYFQCAAIGLCIQEVCERYIQSLQLICLHTITIFTISSDSTIYTMLAHSFCDI